MQNELDVRQALAVYHKIVQQGTAKEHYHLLDGIRAWSDQDGYTVFLGNDCVTLSVFFHNKYHFDSPDTSATADFMQRIKRFSLN